MALKRILAAIQAFLPWLNVESHSECLQSKSQTRSSDDCKDGTRSRVRCYYCDGTGLILGSSIDEWGGLSPKPYPGETYRPDTNTTCPRCKGTGYWTAKR